MTMQDSASFWTDIKNLEEQLTKTPDSFCFARLSGVYLKVGLIEDALHVARQGVMKHPRYLSGQRALSLACHAKGLNDDAMAALKLVTEASPEDVPSQKLLGRLLVEAGNQDAACRVFRAALEFAPDDVECRIELELLERSAGMTEVPSEADEDDETVIEDLEILEELDILDEDQPESEFALQKALSEPDTSAAFHHDPLSTGTLAELYVAQGFIHKALKIYSAILVDNPADQIIAERVAELEALEAGSGEAATEFDDTYEEEVEPEQAFGIPAETFLQDTESMTLPDPGGMPTLESQQVCVDVSWHESGASAVPLKGTADNALATLDGWLENIRKIKSCR
jgi:tetratricopeptide (TPR) repeat protein